MKKNNHKSLDELDKPPSCFKNPEVKIVSDLEQCYSLWRQFVCPESLFDTWEFRLAFWEGYRYQPYFITLRRGNEIIAVLPLWYEDDNHQYSWFGSWWQEDNRFLTKDINYLPFLLSICPQPVRLNAIKADLPLSLNKDLNFQTDFPKFTLDLERIKSLDDFLARFNKKRRYNLKRDKRIIEAQNPQIIFDRFTDFNKLVYLSKQRFSQKGELADWHDGRRVEAFKRVIKFGKKQLSYHVRMISVVINQKIAAVDLIALFNHCYYPIKCGYDVKNFPGIGNFVNLFEIEDALSLGMKKIDFLEIDYGWKDKWFESTPLLKYEK